MSKANYTLVGLFIILLSTLLVGIAFWLSYGLENKYSRIFTIYSEESVNGLVVDSPVKYNGVNVGVVHSIRLNPKNPQEVKITIGVDKEAPISQGTKATLTTQGLTGISYVNLKGGSPTSLPLTIKPGEDYPVIPSEPSLFMRLDTTIQQLSISLTNLSDHVNRFLDEHDQAFSEFLQNTSEASKEFPLLVNNLNKTTTTIDSATHQLLPTTLQTLDQVHQLSAQLQNLTEDIQQNPSMLIRGKMIQPPGPGE